MRRRLLIGTASIVLTVLLLVWLTDEPQRDPPRRFPRRRHRLFAGAAYAFNATVVNDAAPSVRVNYTQPPATPQGPPSAFAPFVYDLASGRITRL